MHNQLLQISGDQMWDKIVARLIENTPLALIVIALFLVTSAAFGGWSVLNLPIRDTEWRIALAVMGVVLGGIACLLLFRAGILGRLSAAQLRRMDIRITKPTEGDMFGRQTVEGTYKHKPPAGWELRIFDFNPKSHGYRPRRKAIVHDDGRWSAHDVYLRGDTGEERIIAAMLIGPAGQALCDYYDKVGDEVGSKARPSLERLPPDIMRCCLVRVIKETPPEQK